MRKWSFKNRIFFLTRKYLNGHSVTAFRGDDAVVTVVVDLVVVDGQEVAVVVGVKAVRRIVVHLVPPPVSLLVAVRVDSEMVVVDVRVVDVAVDVDIIEHFGVTKVLAEPSNLTRYGGTSFFSLVRNTFQGHAWERLLGISIIRRQIIWAWGSVLKGPSAQQTSVRIQTATPATTFEPSVLKLNANTVNFGLSL